MTLEKRIHIDFLLKKGVTIPNPESVDIGPEVDIERISGDGVTLYAGTKIYGSSTLILRGAVIGLEGPVTVKDCYIGPEVRLAGGYFSGAVFLKGSAAGAGAHVREGTILEEAASIAHTVGLKQTLLFPFVTLGSLINFCDCLMSGGTGKQDHSEVGSSYIHFNFTPNQDKATASLLGDVPRGVMLRERPIFLGGQGGLVGPCRLAFGTVIAAGCIYRKDELRPGRLLIGAAPRGGSVPFSSGTYPNIKRIFNNNLAYVANLTALMQWYRHARALLVSGEFPQALLDGLIETLARGIDERVARLRALSRKMPAAIDIYRAGAGENASAQLIAQKQALFDRWPDIEEMMGRARDRGGDARLRDGFLTKLAEEIDRSGRDYLTVIKALKPEAAASGTRWLEGVAAAVTEDAADLIPEMGSMK
ncbi:protein GlmU [Desulfococcus sp.]|uniref:protein GlmU n=1 Tax=Desulfococcus sp. TaxID=2025834 RepID=UPI0035947A7E